MLSVNADRRSQSWDPRAVVPAHAQGHETRRPVLERHRHEVADLAFGGAEHQGGLRRCRAGAGCERGHHDRTRDERTSRGRGRGRDHGGDTRRLNTRAPRTAAGCCTAPLPLPGSLGEAPEPPPEAGAGRRRSAAAPAGATAQPPDHPDEHRQQHQQRPGDGPGVCGPRRLRLRRDVRARDGDGGQRHVGRHSQRRRHAGEVLADLDLAAGQQLWDHVALAGLDGAEEIAHLDHLLRAEPDVARVAHRVAHVELTVERVQSTLVLRAEVFHDESGVQLPGHAQVEARSGAPVEQRLAAVAIEGRGARAGEDGAGVIARLRVGRHRDGDRDVDARVGLQRDGLLRHLDPRADVGGWGVAVEEREVTGVVVERVRRVDPERHRHVAVVAQHDRVVDRRTRSEGVGEVGPCTGLPRFGAGRRERPAVDDLGLLVARLRRRGCVRGAGEAGDEREPEREEEPQVTAGTGDGGGETADAARGSGHVGRSLGSVIGRGPRPGTRWSTRRPGPSRRSRPPRAGGSGGAVGGRDDLRQETGPHDTVIVSSDW